jgi:hypothetical protein
VLSHDGIRIVVVALDLLHGLVSRRIESFTKSRDLADPVPFQDATQALQHQAHALSQRLAVSPGVRVLERTLQIVDHR